MLLKRIPSLDGFRALSIILILICHSRYSAGFPRGFSDIAAFGAEGVTVFFVISGFLITNLLLADAEKYQRLFPGRFYLRRAFRILPVFLLYTLFIYCWQHYEDLHVTPGNFVHAFTLTVNFDPNRNWYLGHLWSLSVEEQFYIFWPVVIMLAGKRLKAITVVLIFYCCVCHVISHRFPGYATITLSPFFDNADAILIGAYGGIWFFENKEKLAGYKLSGRYGLQLLAVCLASSVVGLSGYGKLPYLLLPFGRTMLSAAILFLLLCYVLPASNLFARLMNYPAVVHIGVLSYSIYIWQEFFFTGSKMIVRTLPFNFMAIYLVAACSFYCWERPFLKLRNRLISESPRG